MNIRPALYSFYCRVQARIVPGLLNSQSHYFRVLRSNLAASTRWLDLGAGHQIVPPWIHSDGLGLVRSLALGVGVDLDEAGLRQHRDFQNRAICDLKWIPFVDGAFNLISANMVAEHLEEPTEIFREVFRVLEPGGLFIIHTPNRRNYQSAIASLLPQAVKDWLLAVLDEVKSSDVFETFYRVNTEQDIKCVADKTGFDVAQVELVNTSTKTKLLGPLAIPELLWVRILEKPKLRNYRADIIAVLKKRDNAGKVTPAPLGSPTRDISVRTT